jgi:hypothetical protein
LVDFGLAKEATTIELEQCDNLVIGTDRFMSMRANQGYGTHTLTLDQSYRDDLESWAYVYCHLGGVQLPWTELQDNYPRSRHRRIAGMKKKFAKSLEAGYASKYLTNLLESILDYAETLKFGEKPNFDFLRDLIKLELSRASIIESDRLDLLSDEEEEDSAASDDASGQSSDGVPEQVDSPDTEGTWIQCEDCSVWQHTSCMNVKTVPKQYYCEECKPLDGNVGPGRSEEKEAGCVLGFPKGTTRRFLRKLMFWRKK